MPPPPSSRAEDSNGIELTIPHAQPHDEILQQQVRVLQSRPSSAFPDAAKKSETDLPAAYLSYLDEMKKAWPDLPDLTITYKEFGYAVQVPKQRVDIPNLYSSLRDGLIGLNPLQLLGSRNPFPNKRAETVEFRPIHGASGVVRPGELTLVLAPPGHGKSVLLKGLAGRLQRDSDACRGEIRWNGLTSDESKVAGQELSKMCVFVEQGDVHFPMLTVRETFQFALDNSNADVTHLASAEFTALQAKKVDLMLELLGLKECADTVVGNNMLRGVSGGQKKRVTLGEMMIGQARALFLDEISTGLDAAATFDITSALKKWTRVMRGSAYVALLQPAPEVFDMFDNIILLREGVTVFSGTRAELDQHFKSMNITPNPNIDFADWLVEFLSAPGDVWRRDMESHGHMSHMRSLRKSFREEHPDAAADVAPTHDVGQYGESLTVPTAVTAPAIVAHIPTQLEPSQIVFHLDSGENVTLDAPTRDVTTMNDDMNGATKKKGLGQIVTSHGIPLTTGQLRKAYDDSRIAQNIQTEISDINFTLSKKSASKSSVSPVTAAQYYQAQSWGLWHHTKACLHRQFLVMSRSREFILPRLIQSICMGLIIGSLYYQLGIDQFSPRLGLSISALIFVAFANMAEVPLASQFKLVVYKQVDAGFYSTFSYICSVVLMHFPLAITECFIFGSLLYWMSGFTADAGRYFFFILIILGVNLSIGSIFRTVAYLTSNADVAINLAGPITSICLLFGGFLITKDKIPDWLIFIYYLSPFSWGLRSAGINEFKDARYDFIDTTTDPTNTLRQGDVYLNVWQISTNTQWKWAGIGYMIGLFVFFVFMSALTLSYLRSWLTVGTRRVDSIESDQSAVIEVRVGARTTSMNDAAALREAEEDANQMKFTQMNLSFIDLKYSVDVEETNEATGLKEKKSRQLLAGINGFARAGELTALMGSSGAGKTTLMDVIAGRKTSGTITGEILVDGHPQTFPTFNRLMGYCEQQDILIGTDTVREAIAFSAKLRLPPTVSDAVRERFVDQILDDLELTPIANRLIGDQNIEGLSPGELKRVTIGVELAANPTFLFLDEPTSGLDSRAALIVCRVIRKIARRGRSVVCTIHQPSAELFGMFDRLLLLKSGGKEVYFGPVGEDGVDLVSYFMNADIGPEYFRPALPEKVNPASWMLDVVGAGTSAKGKIAQYDEVYKTSSLRDENMRILKSVSTPVEGQAAPRFDAIYAASYSSQFYEVLRRLFTVYWRDVRYNFTKFILTTILGVVFGLVYLDIGDDDEAGMTSKISAMFNSAGSLGVLQSSNALPIVFRLREVFYRERASNFYAPWVYSTSLAIVELPYLFFCTSLFTIPLYFLIGFENDVDLFFRYLLAMYLMSIVFCYLGQLLASLMPNIQVANILQGLTFTFLFQFGGVYIQKNAMPTGWHWMYYLDAIPKAFIPLCIQQFYCDGPDCPMIPSVRYAGGGQISKWHFVQEYLGTARDFEDYYLAYLVLTIVILRLAILISIEKVSHIKR